MNVARQYQLNEIYLQYFKLLMKYLIPVQYSVLYGPTVDVKSIRTATNQYAGFCEPTVGVKSIRAATNFNKNFV